ncbi:stage II sporulation protein E [Hydrogenispora ethanolica]|uniref:stage II sporulation protein E n=1 Tax=Hydrogenispora ethanolica TaxID=1082276 RepID=UPI001405150B|nr:stage II sporulation protein E [Hydrogenispora ethanolica]
MAGELTLQYQKDAIPNRNLLTECRAMNRDWSTTARSWVGNSLQIVGQLLLAFFLVRFPVPGGIFPAGAAVLLAANRRKTFEFWALAAGTAAGLFTVYGPLMAWLSMAAFLIWFAATGFFLKKRTSLPLVTSFTIWAVLRIGITTLVGPTLQLYGLAALELLATYLLAIVFGYALKFLENPLKAYSKSSLSALVIMVLMALGGLGDLALLTVKLQDLAAVLLLLAVSYLGGGGAGAVLGLSLAIIQGLTGGGLVTLVTLYGISGLLGGVLKDLGRWGTAAGSALGWFFAMGQLHFQLTVGPQVLPWGIGMVAFLCIPRRYLSQVSNYLPNPESASYSREERQKLREVVMGRLDDLASIFEELAKSFNNGETAAVAEQKPDLYSLLDRVCSKNCQHCTGYELCWRENFYSTYREIFDLLALAELYGEVNSGHLKGKLAKTCFQQFKLLTTINHLFERCQTEYQWQKKLEEGKYFLANQLQGMADIICSLAKEISTDTSFRSEVEEHLKLGFNRIGMSIKDIAVVSMGGERLEIKIRQRSCDRKHECGGLAAPLISKLLGTEYMVWERKCSLENGQCSYCLSPVRRYAVKTNVSKLSKSGNEPSGDSHSLQELKDGHFAVILSDGMGSGEKASEESQTTVAILDKLLESGINSDFAVKMVNSVLLLRSPDESFATVDLVLVDLFDGRAEFIKIGAGSSYIKRGREVISIQSTSLPAGILNTVDAERTEIHLQPGDMIILATDGIIDSKPNQAGKEDWVVRALRQVEVVGPEALGDYLLSLAKINQDGALKDDMTVVVLQFVEREAE